MKKLKEDMFEDDDEGASEFDTINGEMEDLRSRSFYDTNITKDGFVYDDPYYEDEDEEEMKDILPTEEKNVFGKDSGRYSKQYLASFDDPANRAFESKKNKKGLKEMTEGKLTVSDIFMPLSYMVELDTDKSGLAIERNRIVGMMPTVMPIDHAFGVIEDLLTRGQFRNCSKSRGVISKYECEPDDVELFDLDTFREMFDLDVWAIDSIKNDYNKFAKDRDLAGAIPVVVTAYQEGFTPNWQNPRVVGVFVFGLAYPNSNTNPKQHIVRSSITESRKIKESAVEVERMKSNLISFYKDELLNCETREDVVDLVYSSYPDVEESLAYLVAEDLMQQVVYPNSDCNCDCEEDYGNEDHERDFDDADSAYFMGGHASMEDYYDAYGDMYESKKCNRKRRVR